GPGSEPGLEPGPAPSAGERRPQQDPGRAPALDHVGHGVNDPRSAMGFVRWARGRRPDVLVASLWRSVLVGMLARPFLPGTRFMVYLHNTRFTNPLDRMVHQVALRVADAVLCDSGAAKDALVPAGVAARRMVQVVRPTARPSMRPTTRPAAVPVAAAAPAASGAPATTGARGSAGPTVLRSAPAPGEPIRLVFWGRIAPQKRVDRVVRLLAALERTAPGGAMLEIIGPDEGPRAEIERLAHDLGLSALVTWHGPLPWEEIREHASRAAFFVQLSDYEGLAMAVAEAMGLGLIPVVTPVGDIPHRTRDGVNAVHAHPPLDDLAEHLRDLARAPRRYQRMSRAAAEVRIPDFVEEFTRACREVAAR
ncbi:glycosyltransferase family 4 protein, partial [Brachybacterium sp. p3-SID1565]|uniref:glycosyltransferase family 4 protein n=1 Tax=Brachybacterium sp. p3-SID1565 TaxID=2916046 RepID=UPI0021A63656